MNREIGYHLTSDSKRLVERNVKYTKCDYFNAQRKVKRTGLSAQNTFAMKCNCSFPYKTSNHGNQNTIGISGKGGMLNLHFYPLQACYFYIVT